MSQLPGLSSFVSASDQERSEVKFFLAEHYGWEVEEETITRAKDTASSLVFQANVQPAGRIIIKSSSWFSPGLPGGQVRIQEALEAVYGVSEVLRQRGIGLAPTFLAKDGQYAVLWNGLPTSVSGYIDGLPFDFSEQHFQACGGALAKLHAIGQTWLKENPSKQKELEEVFLVEAPYEESREVYQRSLRADVLKGHDHCSVPEVCAAVREQIKLLDETMDFIDASGVNAPERARGIVHNDVNAGNVLFRADHSFQAFLDFDQAGIAPYVWDLGNALTSFAWGLRKKSPETDFEALARSFLQSYHACLPLPADEYRLCLAATQRWDVMRILRSLRRHYYENDRLPELLPKIKDRLLERLRIMPQILSFLTDEWIQKNILHS